MNPKKKIAPIEINCYNILVDGEYMLQCAGPYCPATQSGRLNHYYLNENAIFTRFSYKYPDPMIYELKQKIIQFYES